MYMYVYVCCRPMESDLIIIITKVAFRVLYNAGVVLHVCVCGTSSSSPLWQVSSLTGRYDRIERSY